MFKTLFGMLPEWVKEILAGVAAFILLALALALVYGIFLLCGDMHEGIIAANFTNIFKVVAMAAFVIAIFALFFRRLSAR